MFSEAFASLLSQRGNDVVSCAATPAEALVISRQLRPDVLLLDLHFPGVHGADAVTLLHTAIVSVPIVVLTAEHDAELLRQALKAGADGVVLKSDGVAEIEQVIRDVRLRSPAENRRASDKIWSRQARALAQRQARIVEARDLTPRERQVIVHLVQGKSTAAIASTMNVGNATLHAHLQHLFVKLGVHSRLELVAYAMRRGIVSMDSGTEPDEGYPTLADRRKSTGSGAASNIGEPPEGTVPRETTNTRRKMVQTTVGSTPSPGSE
jgi:two-component system nitrate/nitrite response regulator NarL